MAEKTKYHEQISSSHPQLLVDIGGVVIDWDYNRTYRYLIEEHSVPQTSAEKFFDQNVFFDFYRGTPEDEICDRLRGLMNVTLTNKQLELAHNQQIFALVPGMKALISRLSQNHELIFVTDTNPWQDNCQHQLIDLSQFKIFKSHQMGIMKADLSESGKAAFFDRVLSDIRLPAENCLLIDDSENKLEVARNLGIQTIAFKNAAQLTTQLRDRSIPIEN